MVTPCCHMLRGVRFLGKTLLSVLMICCLTDVACSDGKSDLAYDVTLRRLEQISPGTIIGNEAPQGWSHLLLKSYSRPSAGDRTHLSATVDRLTRLLFTAIVADVKPERSGDDGKRYKLAEVAIGLGTRIGDKDIVITPDTQRQLGAGLGILARIVLRTTQDKLGDITIVARSAALMIFDAPSLLLMDGKHKPIVLRYAVLVEERTGRLNTLVWALGREDGKYSGPIGAIQWLPPNFTGDCVLHVDDNEFSLGQPTEKAFAIIAPPKGQKEIRVDNDLIPFMARSRFTTAAAAELENKLREALQRQ